MLAYENKSMMNDHNLSHTIGENKTELVIMITAYDTQY